MRLLLALAALLQTATAAPGPDPANFPQVLDRGRAHTGTDLDVYLPKVRNIREIDADTIIPGPGFIEDGPAMKASLAEFERALQYIVAEATRLKNAGATADAAIKQANWGPYAAWIASDRNGPVAVRRVYDAIDGTLK
jgi:hypothetical protein